MKTITHPFTKKEIRECLAGVIVPVFTPANEDHSIDMPGMKNFIRYFSDLPYITACFVRCGLGKMFTYSVDETKACIDLVMENLGGKKYAFFGTFGEFFDGSASYTPEELKSDKVTRPDPDVYLKQSIELALHAQKAGATAGVLAVPTALDAKPGQKLEDTIFDYYRAVREAVEIPLLLYNIPHLPDEYKTTPEMVHRLCELGGFWGMKLSSNDMNWFTQLEAAAGPDFAMIAGSESIYYHALCTGGLGVIGQGADVNPEVLQGTFKHFMAGDLPAALQAQHDSNKILSAFSGLDAPLSGLAYIQRQGVDMKLFPREEGCVLPPKEEIDRAARVVDEFCAPYRVPEDTRKTAGL